MLPFIAASILLTAPAGGAEGPADPPAGPAARAAVAPSTRHAPAPAAGTDESAVPPGAPADQALWKEAHGVSRRITLERIRSNGMQWRIRRESFVARLDSVVRGQAAEAAARARDLLPRLVKVTSENHSILTRQWPVDPTRGCGYPALTLEGVMNAPDDRQKPPQLAAAREEVTDCLSRARPALNLMARSNDELEKLIAETEAVLPPLPVAPLPAAGGGATPPPLPSPPDPPAPRSP